MVALSKLLIGAMSIVYLLFGLVGIFLSGIFASLVDGSGALASLMTILPVLLVGLSVLGFWSITKDNRPGQYAFAIFLLMGWYIGTIVGGIIILMLLISNNANVDAYTDVEDDANTEAETNN